MCDNDSCINVEILGDILYIDKMLFTIYSMQVALGYSCSSPKNIYNTIDQ